jgi:TfoX/Sxy family transcriptional regulator of competence genes
MEQLTSIAYNQDISDRIREALVHLPTLEEKEMFGGVCFMVDGKMCLGVMKEEMMCRIDPAMIETVLDMNGCRPMTMGGKAMHGYVLISEEGMKHKKAFEYWIGLSLEFNKVAKASRKRKP